MTMSGQQRTEAEILRRLGELGGELTTEEDVIFEGTKFIIPKGLSYTDTIAFCKHKMREEEEEAEWFKKFNYLPLDGAHATKLALVEIFGTLSHSGVDMGFFGKTPPRLIDLEVGFGKTVQVPWGTLSVPALPGVEFEVGSTIDIETGMPQFMIKASGKKKMRFKVEGVFRAVEAKLKSHSVYRGQAITAGYEFMDLGRVDPAKVIYSEAVTTQLEASIWSRLRHPEALRRLGVSLKKSVLLFGKYGVGKTLAAYLTAQEAVKAEQTFILVRPGKDSIEQAIALAGMYEPAVVFCEDVDRIASGDEENGRITELLELFDGARAKGREIMVILTTNFVESIHKGMMRPGRLDAVIEITAPDRDGSVRLLRTLVPDEAIDTTITKAEWDKVGEAMDGYLPAFIAAVAERAASYLTVRVGGEIDGKKLKAEDFIEAANGLRVQESLMEGAKDVPEDRGLGQAMAEVVTGVVRTEIVEHVLNVPSDN